MTSLHNELIRIIDGKLLKPVFQPVISLHQQTIIGYEALIRGPSNSSLHSPFNLFDTAGRFGLQAKLEFVCREITLKRFAELAFDAKLFLNASPSVLLEPDFKKGETLRLLEQFNIAPHSIIIELTEHQPTDDYDLMREAVSHYQNMGFEIALDDLGAGYSGLRLWSELRPHYVKIDKHFIQGLHQDPVKLNFVRSIQAIAQAMNCKVIAEGIEIKAEYQAIEKLGITHAQGFYFARPAAQPLTTIGPGLFVSAHTMQIDQHNKIAADISQWIVPVSAQTAISDVMTLFHQNTQLQNQPLVDNGKATGLICREKFLSKLFSSRYGLELYGKQAIKSFIEHAPLLVDANTPLEKVSQQVTAAIRSDQAFIITDNGQYAGVGTLLDLLEEITRQQIQNAKHANPLTLLPGNVPMNEKINRLLNQNSFFAIAYFDLDHFKPFNDAYGYSAGDDIIKAVADTLNQHITPESGTVGHIGGDDFIVILTRPDWLKRCQDILDTFKSVAPSFYNEADVKAGGITSENRQGQSVFFPLLSLSVGLVDPLATSQCQSHVEIADLASEAKKLAKKIDGNSFFINRRQLRQVANPVFISTPGPVVKLHSVG
ncbi:MAG: GGDEF domain-containing protein [Gammaproteobacteria bacterium HGW-Gammaproteobacteria-3]|nr:MAG: GGDEF domain-containing protein [Gammaproteobacteria bacterium HGW-Gammaproteobacteria-3]